MSDGFDSINDTLGKENPNNADMISAVFSILSLIDATGKPLSEKKQKRIQSINMQNPTKSDVRALMSIYYLIK